MKQERTIGVKRIIAATAQAAGVPVADLVGRSCRRRETRPRQVAMWLARTRTSASLPAIGRRMNRDHTTVMHGLARIARLLESDPAVRKLHDAVVARIESDAVFRWTEAEQQAAREVEARAAKEQAAEEAARAAQACEPSGVAWRDGDGFYGTPRDYFAKQNERFLAALRKAHPEMATGARAGEGA